MALQSKKAAGVSAFKPLAESAAAVSDAPARRGNFGTLPKGCSASTKLVDFTRQMEYFIVKLDDVDSSTTLCRLHLPWLSRISGKVAVL